jgi:hypothetical protein
VSYVSAHKIIEVTLYHLKERRTCIFTAASLKEIINMSGFTLQPPDPANDLQITSSAGPPNAQAPITSSEAQEVLNDVNLHTTVEWQPTPNVPPPAEQEPADDTIPTAPPPRLLISFEPSLSDEETPLTPTEPSWLTMFKAEDVKQAALRKSYRDPPDTPKTPEPRNGLGLSVVAVICGVWYLTS